MICSSAYRSAAFALSVLLALASPAMAQTGSPDLASLTSLRNGRDTDFVQVEQLAVTLLSQCTTRDQRRAVYCELVEVYAQSAMARPDKAIDYAGKALELGPEPALAARLHTYWGDAIQVTFRGITGQGMAEGRRRAAMHYLAAMKLVCAEPLPEKRPSLPSVPRFTINDPDSAAYKRAEEEHRLALNARNEAERVRRLVDERDVAAGQIVFMYTRRPYATREITQLASDNLPADVATRLSQTVTAAVQERRRVIGGAEIDEMAAVRETTLPTAGPLAPVAQSPPVQPFPKRWVSAVVAVILAVVGIWVAMVLRRRQA